MWFLCRVHVLVVLKFHGQRKKSIESVARSRHNIHTFISGNESIKPARTLHITQLGQSLESRIQNSLANF